MQYILLNLTDHTLLFFSTLSVGQYLVIAFLWSLNAIKIFALPGTLKDIPRHVQKPP